MEINFDETQEVNSENHFFYFSGNGKDLFAIRIVNLILTILTLGFYYPWAKAKTLKYLYSEVHLNNEPFTFHGTGKEMFKGFIKVFAVILVLYFLPTIAQFSGASPSIILLASLTTILGFLLLVPIAVHGSMRYRMSRTSYRGIHFGYRGSLKELAKVYYLNLLFTILSFGIYSPWMTVKLRKYIVSNIRFGDKSFYFDGDGSDLFLINLKFIALGIVSVITVSFLGVGGLNFSNLADTGPLLIVRIALVYLVLLLLILLLQGFYKKDVFNFNFDHSYIGDDGKFHSFYGLIENKEVFSFLLKNIPLLIFTVGIAWPWVQSNLLKLVFYNLQIDGTLNLDDVTQTESPYTDASGEDLGDFLDIDII